MCWGLSACAPSLATMQPAHVAAQGHFEGTAALELGVPTGTLTKVVDAGETLSNAAAQGMDLTEQERRQVFEAGVNLAASPPAIGQHLMIAYTPVDNLEINLRNAGGGWRLGGRYQVLHQTDGPFDLSVGIGGARSAYAFPIGDVLPILTINDFVRYTIDVPVLLGRSNNWFRAWIGPRFLYSRFSTSMTLEIPGAATDVASFEGHATYIGAQGGIALGYQKVFLGIELTMAQMYAHASVTFPPAVAAVTPFDFDGFVIYPALGLMVEL